MYIFINLFETKPPLRRYTLSLTYCGFYTCESNTYFNMWIQLNWAQDKTMKSSFMLRYATKMAEWDFEKLKCIEYSKVQDGPNLHNSTSHQLVAHLTLQPQGRPLIMPPQEGPLPILSRVGPLRAPVAPIRPRVSLHLIQELEAVVIHRLKWL